MVTYFCSNIHQVKKNDNMTITMIMIKMPISSMPPAPLALTATSTVQKHCAHPSEALFFTLNNNPMRQIHSSYFTDMEVED